MSPKALSEDQLVQATFAQYLVDHLKWDESLWAMEETLGPDGDPAPAHLAGSSVRCQAIDWERFRAQYLDLGVDDDVPF